MSSQTALPDTPALRILFEDERLKISHQPGAPGLAYVVFNGIALKMAGAQPDEFVKTLGEEVTAYFVTDKARGWFNGIDERVRAVLTSDMAANGVTRTVTIGNSMGGFGALVFARDLPGCTHAIAFVPQSSIKPNLVPFDKRYLKFARTVRRWTMPDAAAYFAPGIDYSVIHGTDGEEDTRHADRLCAAWPAMRRLRVAGGDHKAAQALKRRGVSLARLIHAIVSGAEDPAALVAGTAGPAPAAPPVASRQAVTERATAAAAAVMDEAREADAARVVPEPTAEAKPSRPGDLLTERAARQVARAEARAARQTVREEERAARQASRAAARAARQAARSAQAAAAEGAAPDAASVETPSSPSRSNVPATPAPSTPGEVPQGPAGSTGLEINLFGLQRSGNHGVVAWLAQQAATPPVFLNNVEHFKDPYRFFRAVKMEGVVEVVRSQAQRLEELRAADKPLVIVSYESLILPRLSFMDLVRDHDRVMGPCARTTRILLVRDFFNWAASRLRLYEVRNKDLGAAMANFDAMISLWATYAREYLGETRYLRDAVTISFTRWASDEAYRAALLEKIGLPVVDNSNHRVPDVGGGSSFDQTAFSGAAAEMATSERWRHLNHERYAPAVAVMKRRRKDIEPLNKAIFGADWVL
ncbi:alpha/beta fold hydrolase [Acuticoccus yangtzensis]|uniref:alpha/beta fold hydrolase n=1 Tax=Acuticoccus yangtzensis TaxID=1443441 RepID=UPI0009498F7D|nr:hypothetical protein [Acuticoccus yangtzensis]